MVTIYWIHRLEHTDVKSEGYIGITVTKPEYRWGKHRSDALTGKHCNTVLSKEILNYPTELLWEVIFTGTNEECTKLEKELRPTENIGWNIAAGGTQAWLGRKHTEETKQKISQAQIGPLNHMYGKQVTDETRAKQSAATKGQNNPRARKVRCIETQQVFATAREAAAYVGLSHASNLCKACKGVQKTCAGYTWEYI